MASTATVVLLACLLQAAVQPKIPGRDPVGVVIEYDPCEFTKDNIEEYEHFIIMGLGYCYGDIVVFPEGTLTRFKNDAVPVPDPKDKIIPYQHPLYSNHSAISRISELAAEFEIYVVVNLLERDNCTKQDPDCPPRGYYIYNTNVAFDRKGTVVARYRKFNVLIDFGPDKPKTAELSIFKTDFGLTFGMFTCFDILFKTPALDLIDKNITFFVFPTSWTGELPFLTSVQLQSGWSWALNVTLLAAGVNNPETGHSGSGVYLRRRFKDSWTIEKKGSGVIYSMLTGKYPLEKPEESSFFPTAGPTPNQRGLNLKQDPTVASATSKVLDPKLKSFKEKICHNQLCCNFDIIYNKTIIDEDDETLFERRNYTYRAMAFQGQRNFRGSDSMHKVEYCALVLCVDGVCTKKPTDGKYPLHFHEINIKGDFSGPNSLQMPSTLVWKEKPEIYSVVDVIHYSLFKFDVQKKKDVNTATMNLVTLRGGLKNLITFGVYGRKFD